MGGLEAHLHRLDWGGSKHVRFRGALAPSGLRGIKTR